MDSVDLKPLIEDLDDNIDDLEETLEPLLKDALSTNASKLPLLDKAKLYVLVTYAIESTHLSLNGTKAKEHPVFTELTRVRQYFQKIKEIETGPAKPTQRLDVPAANRFISAGLAGNDKYDQERALQQAKEKAIAKLKAEQLGKKRKTAETAGGAGSQAEQEESPQVKKSRQSNAAAIMEEGAPKDKGMKKSKSQDKAEEVSDEAEDGEDADESATRKKKSSRVPLGHKEAFKQLLKGPIAKPEEPAKKKSKSKSKKKSG